MAQLPSSFSLTDKIKARAKHLKIFLPCKLGCLRGDLNRLCKVSFSGYDSNPCLPLEPEGTRSRGNVRGFLWAQRVSNLIYSR